MLEAERRDHRGVRGTITEDLETGMGRKMPSSLQSRRLFFWGEKKKNKTAGQCRAIEPGMAVICSQIQEGD